MIVTVTLNASIDKAYYMERAIENGTEFCFTRTVFSTVTLLP